MVRVKFYNTVLDTFLNNPRGETGRYLKEKGKEIQTSAKAKVGVRTGNLRRSIHMRHLRDSRGQYLWIGSTVNYALLHHEGTKPHVIVPKGGKVLRFVRGAQVIYAHAVNHPGNKANRYLARALEEKI